MPDTPEQLARQQIDAQLAASGWAVETKAKINLAASHGVAKRVRTTAGQAEISRGDLKELLVQLAPVAEQTRIVAEVERRLSVVEELESVVSASLQRATRLRQSILPKAFTGELT